MNDAEQHMRDVQEISEFLASIGEYGKASKVRALWQGVTVARCETCKRVEGQTTPEDEAFATAMLWREAELYDLTALSVTIVKHGDTVSSFQVRAAAHRGGECGVGTSLTLIGAIDRAVADLGVKAQPSV